MAIAAQKEAFLVALCSVFARAKLVIPVDITCTDREKKDNGNAEDRQQISSKEKHLCRDKEEQFRGAEENSSKEIHTCKDCSKEERGEESTRYEYGT